MPDTPDPAQIPEGTEVVADKADLGESDVSKLVVKGAVTNPETGEPALEVKKGGPFKKTIIVPADRIGEETEGQVAVDLNEMEVEKLSSFGTSVLPPREDHRRDYLSGVVPDPTSRAESDAREATPEERHERQAKAEAVPLSAGSMLKALGPGIISGAADNDPTTVGTLAVIGSQTIFGLSWLLVLVLPMMASVQAVAAAVGVSSGRDLQSLIRLRFGRVGAWVALAALVGVNLFTLAADTEGGASALGLITHVDWHFFILPLALGIALTLTLGSYEWVRRALTSVLFVFLLYIPAAFLAHPNWGDVLRSTFVPHISFSKDYVAGALALLGTTLTSYVYYWQTIEEVEQGGTRPRRLAQLDATSGMVVATVIFWFILVATGATLGVHHQQVQTAQDAANALKPIAGPLAQYLFAVGLLASALLALPVLAGTTAYAVSETMGWPVGLSRQPWRSQGFYLVLLGTLILVTPLTFLHIEPMTLLFVAGIIGGIGTPLLLALMLIIANDSKLMRGRPIGSWLKVLGWGTVAIVSVATAAYFISQLL